MEIYKEKDCTSPELRLTCLHSSQLWTVAKHSIKAYNKNVTQTLIHELIPSSKEEMALFILRGGGVWRWSAKLGWRLIAGQDKRL